MDEAWKKSSADSRFRVLEPTAAPASVFDEFPAGASLPPDEPTRRHFLKIMGASVALAGGAGCTQPQETIVPYVRAPEQIVPGKPLYYATAMTYAGASMGLLVETHMGRPTKVEGNPLHPAVPEAMAKANERAADDRLRFGATDAFGQAMVLSLYDPDRSQTLLRRGQIDTWEFAYSDLRATLERLAPRGGEGLRLLTGTVVSPTLASQIEELLAKYPNARWHQFEPVNDDHALAGARLAFGEDVSPVYLNTPDVVLALDADPFADGPMRMRHARRFRWQYVGPDGAAMSRIYVAETSSTLSGAAADHRLPVSPRGVVRLAGAVARAFGLELPSAAATIDTSEIPQPWLDAVVEDLEAARGRSVVLAGRSQPPVVHAIAHWLNGALGNVGRTVEYRAPAAARPELAVESIRELAGAMRAKEVSALVILGGNPAYDAPADLGFGNLLAEVPFSLHLSQYANETAVRCGWHVPQTHPFESWSDTRAADGTVSIVQPLIAPLYGGKTAHDMVAALVGKLNATSHDLVHGFWQNRFVATPDEAEFERAWKTALHDGVLAGTRAELRTPTLSDGFAEAAANELAPFTASAEQQTLHATFRADHSVWDGRFANNAWLQELPRPFTKLTWDNAALLAPRTAERHRLKTGDVAEIETTAGRVEMPVFVVPGHPPQTLTLHLGYGRTRAGRVGNVGTDVYPLRASEAMWFAEITGLRNTGRTHELATTQHHHSMAGRHLVRHGTLAEYLEAPEHPAFMAVGEHASPDASMYPEREYDGNKWGLVVNQSACVGCSACVVACQAENNIPVVGKEQVERGREMHWLRIDNYYEGDAANPAVYHQPVLCMHCEYAPCEPVCPVAATTHSDEGLNEMTYNRCIGTRYCSNNCPYKVRRFNFFDFNAELREEPVRQLRPNPDVTVRSRGVMEKCTYCVQRINAARIAADKQDRPIRDGELLTACQAACPTQALVFGNLNDAQSAVRELAESSLNYSLLGDLNTRPRTTYLAALRNPHPSLKET